MPGKKEVRFITHHRSITRRISLAEACLINLAVDCMLVLISEMLPWGGLSLYFYFFSGNNNNNQNHSGYNTNTAGAHIGVFGVTHLNM